MRWFLVITSECAIPIGDDGQVVILDGLLAAQCACHLPLPNGDAVDVFDITGYLLPIGGALVERVASAIEPTFSATTMKPG